MSIVRWEDPPPYGDRREKKNKPRRTSYWSAVAEELRANPGRWALVLEGESYNSAGGIAPQIKRGDLAAFRPEGSFEALSRTTGGGCRVYARYIGEASNAAA